MPAKFCAKDGCMRVAVRAPRSSELCRECYNADIMPTVEMVMFRVTATSGAKVTDARTQQSRGNGHVVELDPAETNVAALVAAGLGEVVVDAKPARPAKTAAAGD